MLDTLGWDIGPFLPTTLLNRYDRFVAIAPSDTACVLYNGFEPHAFVMVASLAIFRRQADPKLVLDAPRIECLLNVNAPIQWNGTGDILFVAVNIEWQVPRRVAYPLAVIDLTRERYSFIAGRALSAHTVTEINGRIYRLTERDAGRPRNHYAPSHSMSISAPCPGTGSIRSTPSARSIRRSMSDGACSTRMAHNHEDGALLPINSLILC